MQLVPRYLVNNRIEIISNEAGFVTEYRPVYNRQLKVYRGIDNNIQFRLLNADQKPINSNLYTPRFVAFDEKNNMIIERDGVVQDDGSSQTRGLFTITITENDLLNVPQQYISYNVYLVDSNSDKVLTYSDSHFHNNGTIFIDGGMFPGPRDTYSLTTFAQSQSDSGIWYSESLDAEPGINGNEALHTAVVYTDEFAGDVIVQATLDNQVTGATVWADVGTLTLTGSETEPTPINFNGVFNHLRFKADANPADKITKILVRN